MMPKPPERCQNEVLGQHELQVIFLSTSNLQLLRSSSSKKHQVFLFQINKYYVVVGSYRPQPTTWNAIRFFFIAGIYSHCVQCVRTHKMRTRTQGYTLLFGQESCQLTCDENSNMKINILLTQCLAKINQFL